MPRYDKTGPQGEGPKTGRRRGSCDNNKQPQSKPDKNDDSWLDIILRVLKLLKK